MTDHAALVDWVERYRMAWGSNDPAAIAVLFTEDAVYFTEPYHPPWRGHAEIVEGWLAHLRAFAKLQSLTLAGSKVTDAGLVHLRGLTRLKELNLKDTAVSNTGIEGLRKALPCRSARRGDGFHRFCQPDA